MRDMTSKGKKLSDIRGIQTRFLPKLKKLGIETVKDLLLYIPIRYEDFSKIYTIEDLIPNQEATITAEVLSIQSRNTWKRNLYLVEAELQDHTGTIRATWFNQPYIKNILAPGRRANFAGKITESKKTGEINLSNPTYELVNEHMNHETRHTGRIIPIYKETKGLTSKGIRFLIQPALKEKIDIPDIIPDSIRETLELPDIQTAIQAVHFPNTIEDALSAKRRFAFEDLFLLQIITLKERMKIAAKKAHSIQADISFIKSLLETLPFELTESQKRSLWEIIKDIERGFPMNRLLEGDVGSGKTVIAGISALTVSQSGFQSALMAPTEILAQQHYRTLTKLFKDHEVNILLFTGSEARMRYDSDLESVLTKSEAKKAIENGSASIIIGTHALIQKGITFKHLALVIIDEQHRFGVEQRATLEREKTFAPHFLSMTATPIPRTLSLTLFGDLDISLITELPKNRKPIITKAIPDTERATAYNQIRAEIKKGRQAFVICPRIKPKETEGPLSAREEQMLSVKTVTEEYEKLSKHIFKEFVVGMVHGKLTPKEKESVMKSFAKNEIQILIATSVVEVGVDIPNATIMMIEGADRFGLAQLHQFRGRVGRAEHQSYCFLFSQGNSDTTKGRLKAIVEAKNGFELAEYDLRLRGPGEFLGTSQTGMPDIAMKAIQNPDLVKEARTLARETLKSNQTLSKHSALKERLIQFEKEIHFE
jgi:ATP-dependent DNA helicase RecG